MGRAVVSGGMNTEGSFIAQAFVESWLTAIPSLESYCGGYVEYFLMKVYS